MAKRRLRLRGRTAAALLLIGFLLVTTGVIWRRSHGIDQARDLRRLEARRAELLGQRARLETEIRDASSRARLAPIAEQRLRMHVPNDSQVILLPRPTTSHGSP